MLLEKPRGWLCHFPANRAGTCAPQTLSGCGRAEQSRRLGVYGLQECRFRCTVKFVYIAVLRTEPKQHFTVSCLALLELRVCRKGGSVAKEGHTGHV